MLAAAATAAAAAATSTYAATIIIANIIDHTFMIFFLVGKSRHKGKKEFKIMVNFSHFWPFGTPLLAPRGLHSCLSFSTTLSTLDQCNNNEIFLPE